MMAAVQSREREGTYRVTLTDMHELMSSLQDRVRDL